MSGEDRSAGPLDIATLEVLVKRAANHPLVDGWAFRPDAVSPRLLEFCLDADRYPEPVEAARLDVRWFVGGEYTIHYVESRGDDVWQCRWDCHPEPCAPVARFHPPPDATTAVEPSEIETAHHLGVLLAELDRITERIAELH